MKRTLIIVDLQYDFLKGGSLAVTGADALYAQSVDLIRPLFDQVILTADFHPENHVSFSTFPPHCVANTHGAELAIEQGDDLLLLKGEALDTDEFSAFTNGQRINHVQGDSVYVLGLAGDYCVKQTLLDLLEYAPQKKLYAITDLIHSVDGTTYGPIDYFNGRVAFLTSDQLW